jgi:hypothetical protein
MTENEKDPNSNLLRYAPRFRKKPGRMGNSYYFSIPKALIDNKMISPNNEYWILCIKITKNNKSNLEEFWEGLNF